MNALNLYAGLGGNRHLWPKSVKVTAVENNEKIAMLYAKQFPKDKLVIGDAHQYLLEHYSEFDFIWSSPPCQSHSRLNFTIKEKKYPDFRLYEEITFLAQWFKGKWIVENVKGYYKPLIPPTVELGRHLFWSGHKISLAEFNNFPGFGYNKREAEMYHHKLKWLGLNLKLNDLVGVTTRKRQLIDNCVHPKMGLYLLNSCHF